MPGVVTLLVSAMEAMITLIMLGTPAQVMQGGERG